jgi:hypothetical protein
MANRNQPRKRMDITIAAFAQVCSWQAGYTVVYAYVDFKDQGWDLMPLFAREMKKNGLDPNHRIIMTSNNPQSAKRISRDVKYDL